MRIILPCDEHIINIILFDLVTILVTFRCE